MNGVIPGYTVFEAKGKRPRGRPKRKTQISVRIDQDLMQKAWDFAEDQGYRITDLIERGLIMAMRAEAELPLVSNELRFLVGRFSAEQQQAGVGLAALLALPECRGLSRWEMISREYVLNCLRLMPHDDAYEPALRSYGTRSLPPPSA